MRKAFLFVAMLFASIASGQVYEGSAGNIYVTNMVSGDQVWRAYGGFDANGNLPWQHWSIYTADGSRTSSWIPRPNFSAARVIIDATGLFYSQDGDFKCYAFNMDGSERAVTCPLIAPLPPISIEPPPVEPPPTQPNATIRDVVAVLLRYKSAPSNSKEAIDSYNESLQWVTQANVQAMLTDISSWWGRETYGLNRMNVRVLPPVEVDGNPNCDTSMALIDAKKVLAAAGITPPGSLVIAMPYFCWRYYAQTSGKTIYWKAGASIYPGTLAHELGHAFGLGHNAARLPAYQEYGSCYDQMGCTYSTLTHFMADHKNKLSALTPMGCATTTLRTLYRYPDAVKCGSYYVSYLDDINTAFVQKREFVSASHGGSDTTDVARLVPGQSYTGGGYTFTHLGLGRVTVKATRRGSP